MIQKTDLIRRVNDQERRLQLIYKYNPSLQNLDKNVEVLQSLGLDDRQIKEVVSRGSTTMTQTIINPIDGKEMAIYVEEVSLKKNSAGEYVVFIGNVPYKDFFSKSMLSKEKLEELAKENPEIQEMYKENQKLKSLISMLGKS